MTYSASPMRAKGLTPKPEYAKSWCPVHALGASYRGWNCPICAVTPAMTGMDRPAPVVTKRRSGGDAEDGLARQLEIAGYRDIATVERGEPTSWRDLDRMFVRGFAFGLYLDPPRGFAADFAFPAHRLLVEVDGGAHYATRKQGQHDTERRGLAASIGWTILPVTPEQVRDGSAVELVKRAIETSASAAGGTT